MRTRVPIMSKREALQYAQRHFNEQTNRDSRWPLSKQFLNEKAACVAASELLGEPVEGLLDMKDGTLYPVLAFRARRAPHPQRVRLVGLSRRFVTMETV